MKNGSAPHRHLLLLFGVALVAALFSSARPGRAAQSEELVLEGSHFPLGHRFKNRAWTPLQAGLVNRSGQGTRATLLFTLNVGGQVGRQVSYSRTVWLPARSRREIVLDVFLDLAADTLRQKFIDPKTGRPNVREEVISFPDGSSVEHRQLRIKEPFRARVELFRGEGGGPKASQTEMFANIVHPQGLGVFLVEAYPERDYGGPAYTRDGHEFIYGEIEDDLQRAAEVTGGFGARNSPTPEMLGGPFIARGAARVDQLPRKWAAFQSVHAIVLASPRDRFGLLGLDPLQRSSLMEWLWSGGRVVLLPSTDPEAYRHPFFEKLLPVRLTGLRRQQRTAPLEAAYGGENPYRTEVPHLRAEARPAEGDVLVADAQHVWVARRQVGGGEAWFAAINGEAMSDWRQNLDLWADMLRPDPTPVPGREAALADRVPQLMRQIVGVEAPSRTFVMALLVGYCGLVTVALLWLRRRGRAELGWLVMGLLAVGGLVAARGYSWSVGQRTGFVKGEIGLTVLGNRKGVASSIGFVSFYSPEELVGDARFLNPDTLATAYGGGAGGEGGRQGFFSSLNVRQADRFYLQGLRINPRELFTCRTMTLTDYAEGLALDFGYDAEGFAGTLTNRTGQRLIDCLLVANRAVLQIGDLPPGATVRLDALDRAAEDRLSSTDFVSSEAQVTRSRILALARRLPDGALAGAGRNRRTVYAWPVAFYGWAPTPQAAVDLGAERQPLTRALQLLALPADRVAAEPGARLRVPPGSCGLELRGHASRRFFGDPADRRRLRPRRAGRGGGGLRQSPAREPEDPYRATGWKDGVGPASLEVGFLPPAGLSALRPEEAWLHVEVNARNLELSVAVLDRVAEAAGGGRRERWLDLEVPRGGGRVPVPALARTLGTGGEWPVVQLRLNAPAGEQTTGLTGANWSIRTLDLEVVGRLPAPQGKERP